MDNPRDAAAAAAAGDPPRAGRCSQHTSWLACLDDGAAHSSRRDDCLLTPAALVNGSVRVRACVCALFWSSRGRKVLENLIFTTHRGCSARKSESAVRLVYAEDEALLARPFAVNSPGGMQMMGGWFGHRKNYSRFMRVMLCQDRTGHVWPCARSQSIAFRSGCVCV